MRTAFLIDGFNFYHSLKSLPRHLRWFDYSAYCRHFMKSQEVLHSITYFTALAYYRLEASQRHEVFIEACKAMKIDVVLGKFKKKTKKCWKCNNIIGNHEEKATDVNIALHAYRLAALEKIECVVLVTGDTDMIPAICLIKQDFPATRVGVVFPYDRKTNEMRQVADFTYKTSAKILEQFQLPDKVKESDGKIITRPESWTVQSEPRFICED